MKESEWIDNLVRQKKFKKIWEAIRNILGKRYLKNYVKPCDWTNYFDELFSRRTEGGIV
jgi:hypothetical protein